MEKLQNSGNNNTSSKPKKRKTIKRLSVCYRFVATFSCCLCPPPVSYGLFFFLRARQNYIWFTLVSLISLLLSISLSCSLIFSHSISPFYCCYCHPIELWHCRFHRSSFRSRPICYLLLKYIRCAINLMLMSNCNFKPLSDINYLTFFARTKPMLWLCCYCCCCCMFLADVDVGDAFSSNCKHSKQAARCGTLSF